MRVHFIAIGGAAMHNLAIALHKKGYNVTGSDDEIFEPSKSRLDKYDLLPKNIGWNPDIITKDIDAIILGMHAIADNPELIKAKEIRLKIYSYPEYIYEQSKNKKRIVIGGSHGKTTITSMILHVFKYNNIKFDYLVGAQIEGFETMVGLSQEAEYMVIEGDEYLASPIDRVPKFHHYKPHIALITGIAWDHINVFPTFENYVEQFKIFTDTIEQNGSLIYYDKDTEILKISETLRNDIKKYPYHTHKSIVEKNKTFLILDDKKIELQIFGNHNLENINGAKNVCNLVGISDEKFYKAIKEFGGAAKRLQTLKSNEYTNVYLDFAHSPSKLKATINAVKEQFIDRELIACMELHTFSSLKKEFLPLYKNTMESADRAFVYFNPETIKHKRLEEISKETVKDFFASNNIEVFTDSVKLINELLSINYKNKNLLLMSSGNFDGINFMDFAKIIQ
jgi:UDP-N-acetylmuramate: L-alanyl-gamma-D-glutamyl-meso-diaminopimelate ligase